MLLRIEPTLDDYADYWRYIARTDPAIRDARRRARRRFAMMVVAGAIIFTAVLVNKRPPNANPALWFIMAAVLGGGGFSLFVLSGAAANAMIERARGGYPERFVRAQMAAHRRGHLDLSFDPVSLLVSDEGLLCSEEHIQLLFGWKAVQSVVETDRAFFIHRMRSSALPVPKRVFLNEKEIATFRSTLAMHLEIAAGDNQLSSQASVPAL